MSEQGTQQSLTGTDAERVSCEYYDGCEADALYIAEILHYGEGEKPVRMCKLCAEEHAESERVEFGDDIQRLKPANRYVGEQPESETVWVVAANYADDPHPHVLGVFADEEPASELMDDCRNVTSRPHPVAWDKFETEIQQTRE